MSRVKVEYEVKSICHRYLKNQNKSKILKFRLSQQISIIYGITILFFVFFSCKWTMVYDLHILYLLCEGNWLRTIFSIGFSLIKNYNLHWYVKVMQMEIILIAQVYYCCYDRYLFWFMQAGDNEPRRVIPSTCG